MKQLLKQETPLQYIKGIGPKIAEKLSTIKLNTVKDFIYYFPKAYEDRRKAIQGKDFINHQDQEILTVARIIAIKESGYKMSVIKATVSSLDHKIFQAIWFNQKYLKNILVRDKLIFLKGKLSFDTYTNLFQLQVSDYEVLHDPTEMNKVMPIYQLTAGISQKIMRTISYQIVSNLEIQDYLPQQVVNENSLTTLDFAIKQMHLPDGNRLHWKKARDRIVFDELFQIQLKVAQHYYQLHRLKKGLVFQAENLLLKKYLQNLPYHLTAAQTRVISEITNDVTCGKCMNRLVQGDVGSGKTEVAIAAILLAIENGYQAALMAPTEVLAQQHFNKISQKFKDLNITTVFLSGKNTLKEKKEIYQLISSGKAQLIIGTHAIFQEQVIFTNLGLLVIDEQHRFGVIQREKLISKGNNPHILVMTATPIPRSLSLTIYGDLDRSVIDELPPGRKQIETHWEKDIVKLKKQIQNTLDKGQQVYIIYPLIEESEKMDLKDVITGYQNWSKIFNNVGLLHGKMDSKEKERIIKDFYEKKLDILVSTTVIEVGIDVANATMMIIENAHRFGLAQLHQLRGRVGRGIDKSYCYLISNSKTSTCKKRLQSLETITDGFKLAEIDLEMRGAGDYLGTRQSGMPSLNLTDLIKDNEILQAARQAAFKIIQDDPDLSQYPLLQAGKFELSSRLN